MKSRRGVAAESLSIPLKQEPGSASGRVSFNKPYMVGKELDYIREAHAGGVLSGDNAFGRKCEAWLQEKLGSTRALMTPSCTAALEMSGLLAELKPGDEVIMPSYTFVSTASAFVLRGAVPVFVDIREDTLNIDESKIEAAITPKTKAIVVVHYAGVGCEMDTIVAIARRHRIVLIEDAAQGICASYRGKPLGSFGQMSAFSFHETKNLQAGEGGALVLNDAGYIARAEIIRQKGTNRAQFLQGLADKYTWVDLGSSYLPSELVSAFLWAQLEQADAILERRLDIWNRYNERLKPMEDQGLIRRPRVPEECRHNAHLYYVLLCGQDRARFIEGLAKDGIHAVFHYVPLHTSPAGKVYGRSSGRLEVTDRVSATLVRLPLWIGVEKYQERVIDAVERRLKDTSGRP